MSLLPLFFAAALYAQKGAVAGAAVESKEWKVTRSPERVEEFTGDVRYHAGPDSVWSDWALYKHEQDLWQARGHVRVERTLSSGGVVKARGDRAGWDRKGGRGHLTADQSVDFSRVPVSGEPDLGTAGRIEWKGQDEVDLEDGMHVWGPRLETWAGRGVYSRGARRLDLAGGRPVLVKVAAWEGEEPGAEWLGAVKADAVSALEEQRAMTADGRAVGWIEFPKKSERMK